MLWVAGLLFLGLRKLAQKINHKRLWFLPFTFLTLAVFSLAWAPLPFRWGTAGGLVGWLVGHLLGWLGSFFGISGQIVAAVLLVLVLAFGLVDLLKDHKPDTWAQAMVYATPVLALVAGGSIAERVLHVTHLVANVGPTVVASLAG